ncbi:ABC transporter permease [Lactococcus lactis]|uniref:ABC transporter permease n=1 Tax=Lactococcus lactis TaxID=1358 RepID=A0AAP8E331_9LACT|nr:ABC transporter permease [Lactococcus lactis]
MLIFLSTNHPQIAFTGSRHLSVASLSIILSTLFGFFGFIWTYLRKSCDLSKSKFKIFRETLTLSVAYTSISFAVQIIFWYIIGKTFSGVTFDPFTAGFLVLVFVGIIFYFLISAALSVTLPNLILLLFITFIGGILVSMATNNQKDWWQHNFSFLGTGEATQHWQFNITLIFSALILLTITDFLFAEFSKSSLYNYKFKIIRVFYILIAFLIAFVGIFPAQSWTMPIHNNSAFGLVAVVLIMIIFLKWLVPTISKEFLALSWTALIALILSAVAFMGIHYLSLTVFEIIAFAVAFTWLVMFINSLRGIIQEGNEWQVKLLQK